MQLTQKLLAGGTKNAQVYYIDGEAQSALGKTDAGIASMEQSANLEPTNIDVLKALTEMYMRANRPTDAERVAKRAITFNPNSKEAAENFGFVLAVEKKFDEARTQFQNVAKLDPKDPHPLVLEARTYEDANSLALAMPLLDRALAIDPKNIEALAAKAELASAMHDVKTSIDTYALIFAQLPDNDGKGRASPLKKRSSTPAKNRTPTPTRRSARRSTATAASRRRTSRTATTSRAKADKAGASREWTTAAGANRDNPDALARLGQLAAQNSDFKTAVDDYKRLTEVAGSDPRSYLLLGQAYMGSKNWNAARDAFKASYNLAHTPDALVGLAAADQQARNFTEAIQIYEALDKNAADLVKANPGLLFAMGNAYKGANQMQKAKATFVRFLAFLKPGTQGYTEVQQMIAQIDHPSSTATTPKSRNRRRSRARHPRSNADAPRVRRVAHAASFRCVAYRAARSRARGRARVGGAGAARRAHRYAACDRVGGRARARSRLHRVGKTRVRAARHRRGGGADDRRHRHRCDVVRRRAARGGRRAGGARTGGR